MATPIPTNRATFSLDAICSATRGRVLSGSAGGVVGVSTDSRAIVPGNVFVALRGEAFDGHAHVAAARAAGAAVVVVEDDVPTLDVAVVRVASTLDALGDLARVHARRWRARGDTRVVGITGSAGKTTTRVAISALAEAVFPGVVHASSGNLNNRIGLPMVVFGLEPRHRIAILEMGMNQPGEIAALASVAEPDVGVLTLIASAHTERLGSIEGVAAEKGALLAALAPRGVAIGCGDDARVRTQLTLARAGRRHTYGRAQDADVRIVSREALGLSSSQVVLDRLGKGSISFETPLLGEAGALASAAAVAVVELALGATLTSDVAERAFAAAEVGAGAGRLVPRIFSDGLALIDDSYNANPASMRASIAAAAEIARATDRRLVLVLGEMRELGDDADACHEEVGNAAARSGAHAVIAVVGRARRIAEAARAAGLWAEFRDAVPDATDLALRVVGAGDLVLVKASRGVATEKIVRALEEMHTAPPTFARHPISSRPDRDPGPEGAA